MSGKSWKLHVHILAVELDWYTLCVFWEIKCVVVVSLGVFQLSDTYCRFLSNRFLLYTELKVSGLLPVTPVILSSKRMSLFSTDVVWWNVKMGGGYFCRMKIQIFLSSSVCKGGNKMNGSYDIAVLKLLRHLTPQIYSWKFIKVSWISFTNVRSI